MRRCNGKFGQKLMDARTAKTGSSVSLPYRAPAQVEKPKRGKRPSSPEEARLWVLAHTTLGKDPPKIKPRVSYPVIVQRPDLFANLAGAPRPE
jgi:hypothetical protein